MRITALLSAVLAGAFLFGCSTLPPITQTIGRPVPMTANTQNCIRGNCYVPVFVADCVINVPDTVVNLGGPGGGNRRLIIWVIRDSGYVFSTDSSWPALVPKGSSNFFGTPNVQGAVMLDTVNVTSQGIAHEYGLDITKSDGTRCPQYDPWVIE